VVSPFLRGNTSVSGSPCQRLRSFSGVSLLKF
jgi:hypothetical protein